VDATCTSPITPTRVASSTQFRKLISPSSAHSTVPLGLSNADSGSSLSSTVKIAASSNPLAANAKYSSGFLLSSEKEAEPERKAGDRPQHRQPRRLRWRKTKPNRDRVRDRKPRGRGKLRTRIRSITRRWSTEQIGQTRLRTTHSSTSSR
jgi:hypothetical protein